MGRSIIESKKQKAKNALTALKINQTKLAERLDVTRNPIGDFFHGREIKDELFVEICEVLQHFSCWLSVVAAVNEPAFEIFQQDLRKGFFNRFH